MIGPYPDTEIELRDIKSFTSYFKKEYKYDFTNYAVSSFKRRLQRLLLLQRVSSIEELKTKIHGTPGLAEIIVQEITVNTTEMFRDPSMWKKLRNEILPYLFKNANGNLKIWHAACSSGEEVYSTCILLEEMGKLDKVSITATDINENVINTAKCGVYQKHSFEVNDSNYRILKENSSDNLSKYYKPVDEYNVKMSPELTRNVIFKKFDLSQDNIYTKYDLILCCNVMIYFNFELQERVVRLLNDGLFTGGVLVIGSKETISWCKSAESLKRTDNEEKIYRKI